jgi:PAS domain S-box-containing protein
MSETPLVPSIRPTSGDLREAVAAAGMHTFSWDVAAGTVVWSQGVEALFGLPAGGFDGRIESFVALLPEEDRDRVTSAIDRALRGETPGYAVELRVWSPTGLTRWLTCHGTVFRDDEGRPTRMVGLISDVTGRRAAEVAMRASEERYRTLFVHASEGIVLVGANYRISDANESACRMLGYSHEELLTLAASAIVDPTDLAATALRFPTIPVGGVILSERRFLRKDGTLFPGEVSTKALVDGSFQCVIRDVTERKQLEVQFLLADRMTSLGRLASGVAHELNNPLAYVMLNLDLVARKVGGLAGSTSPETIDLLVRATSDARDGAERMRRIVKMMSAFGRGDEEKTGPVDVNGVLDSAAEIAAMQLRHRARLVRQYDARSPVRANAFRLGQVFVNLLVNAADAMPEGNPSNEIRLRTYTRDDNSVVVEVSDNGAGIAPDVQGRIFDPFFTTKPVGRGTGLGLSVCHAIVTSSGGAIACESTPGKGTTFRVALPVARVLPAEKPNAQPRGSDMKGRVLVVDDDPQVANAVARALEGHDIVIASGGHEALERCKSERFDCVLCDLMMPEVSGLDVWEALRKEEPGAEKRVVFMTGGAVTEGARARIAGLLNSVLEKPIDRGQLLAAVARTIELTRG